MKKYFSLPGILIATCLFASSAAAELPGWYPKSFFLAGLVDALSGSSITIDNLPLLLSPTAKFATANNPDANIKNLKIGQIVGVNTILINKRRLVDQIWLIPESEHLRFNPPH